MICNFYYNLKSVHLRVVWLVVCSGLFLGCAGKGEKGYKISAQPPAAYITCGRSEAEVVRHEESACQLPSPFGGSAYDYLTALTEIGHRRTGTRESRCAAAFIRRTLAFLGYQAEELSYPFPYYEFDPEGIKVLRARDGKDYPAYPMEYSFPLNGTRSGKLTRPRQNLKDCFVYVDSSFLSPRDLKSEYQKWKERGALGIIREANLRPLAAKGLPHSARAHTTSWHYSPLPGLVVANAHELLGETITVTQHARIVSGTGYTVLGQSPQPAPRYIMVTAHLDSWFEGALDDGSGVAALLEIALLLREDPESVLFMAADSEEIGLIGSAAFVQERGLDQVAAVLELDMVSGKNNYGRKTPETAGIMPRFITVSAGLAPAAKKFYGSLAGRKFFLSVPFTRSLTGMLGTDYEWFYAAGIPGIFIYTPSKYYHTVRDTREWVPAEDLQALAEASAEMVRWLRANMDSLRRPPEILPFTFSAEVKAGATVGFEVKLEKAPGLAPRQLKCQVRCYFEQGYEEKVDLKRGGDGIFRGEYRLPWPGTWQFLATVSQGQKFGKRWTVVQAPGIDSRCAPAPP